MDEKGLYVGSSDVLSIKYIPYNDQNSIHTFHNLETNVEQGYYTSLVSLSPGTQPLPPGMCYIGTNTVQY